MNTLVREWGYRQAEHGTNMLGVVAPKLDST